jgi:hypothetical protein
LPRRGRAANRGPEPSIRDLIQHRNELYDNAYASNSHRVLQAAQAAYKRFADKFHLNNIHEVSVQSISLFISYMSIQGLAPNTILTYVSAITAQGHPSSSISSHFLIQRLLKAIRKSVKPDLRLPMTEQLLQALIAALPKVTNNNYEATLFSALFSFAFYGLFRVSELTAAREGKGRTSSLSTKHVKLDTTRSSKSVTIKIAKSKTDQAGRSATIKLLKLGKPSCPYRWCKKFQRIRPKARSYFVHGDGAQVTDRQANKVLKLGLEFLKVPEFNRYAFHSFRIGGCSALADTGIEQESLKAVGRWRSNAYKSYIRQALTVPWRV